MATSSQNTLDYQKKENPIRYSMSRVLRPDYCMTVAAAITSQVVADAEKTQVLLLLLLLLWQLSRIPGVRC